MSKNWRLAKQTTACFLVLAAALPAPVLANAPIDLVLERYIDAGLAANRELQSQQFDLDAALAKLDEARASRWPSLALNARYTRSQGGRVTDLPLGQLVNPAYDALNRLLTAQGQPAGFARVEDQQIQFLRPREQDTRLSFSAPLYAPQIPAAIRAQESNLSASRFARTALARRLVRDITVAYLGWLKAGKAVAIVAASEALLSENLRVNRALLDAGKVTRDRPLRAEAELLAVQQLGREAKNQRDQARNYFNFLLTRALDEPIDAADFEQAQLPAPGANGQRAELDQVQSQVSALDALLDVRAADFGPTVALAVDSGIQGERYAFGPGNNFTQVSVVFQIQLFDGGARAARLRQAQAERSAAAMRLDQLKAQIELEQAAARDDLEAALDALDTAAARERAAALVFEIARRKRDAGSLPQIEFIDARAAFTQAELNNNLTRFDALARAAQLDYATAAKPLPEQFAATLFGAPR